jgi:hypothetical protein
MSTTEKPGRAWVTATVTTLLAVVLVAASGLLWEILDDQDVSALHDPESAFGVFVLAPLAPLGGPGIVGPRDFTDSIVQLGGGLVLVAVVVYLFTWLAARSGSKVATLFGTWIGTVVGVGLGAVTAFEIFIRQNDLDDSMFALQQVRFGHVETGLYWGVAGGLLLGLVAMAVRAMTGRSRSTDFEPTEPAAWPPKPAAGDTSSFAPPSEADRPVPSDSSVPAEETAVAPETGRDQ